MNVDRELINTVMSRARYSVAVVGDPVVLCTFGSCRTIWQQFVKKAAELDAVYPESYSVQNIRQEVQKLSETEPARKLLRLLSQYRQFQLGQKTVDPLRPSSLPPSLPSALPPSSAVPSALPPSASPYLSGGFSHFSPAFAAAPQQSAPLPSPVRPTLYRN